LKLFKFYIIFFILHYYFNKQLLIKTFETHLIGGEPSKGDHTYDRTSKNIPNFVKLILESADRKCTLFKRVLQVM